MLSEKVVQMGGKNGHGFGNTWKFLKIALVCFTDSSFSLLERVNAKQGVTKNLFFFF